MTSDMVYRFQITKLYPQNIHSLSSKHDFQLAIFAAQDTTMTGCTWIDIFQYMILMEGLNLRNSAHYMYGTFPLTRFSSTMDTLLSVVIVHALFDKNRKLDIQASDHIHTSLSKKNGKLSTTKARPREGIKDVLCKVVTQRIQSLLNVLSFSYGLGDAIYRTILADVWVFMAKNRNMSRLDQSTRMTSISTLMTHKT
ncbi:hypothetical protein BCR42DRAFT_396166 [Absidia repens]|uniref:Uncharacterized protein n=1 Tax=Absidia repens TaxID=90262 RepID=A0A1X2I6I7_9FUNG|nr:hypothetical protein BCR42DRAFT_396166 [Absidia repens]